MNRYNSRKFSINQFLFQPLFKYNSYRIKKLSILLFSVCIALFITSTWSIAVIEYPDTSIAVPMPDPQPTPEPATDSDPTPAPEPTPDPTPTPEPVFDGENPLTGLPFPGDLERNRPIAVVLSNEVAALPMNGVSDADIIYEYPVEGGLTRMMAIFQDFSNVVKVGSVRSARHYTVQIATSYDAIFIHAGGSQPLAYNEIKELGIPNFDEVGGTRREIFFRDRSRIGGRRVDNLHSVVTTNDRLFRRFSEYTFRKEHEDRFQHGLIFTDNGTPVRGDVAKDVLVRFSSGKSTSFVYDSAKEVYHLRQFNRDFVDANDNSKPAFTNVLVIKTSVSGIAGDGAGRQNVSTTGTGEGFFICGGKYVEINWSRQNKQSPYTYTNMDGTELELGRGKTFICIIPNRMNVTFE